MRKIHRAPSPLVRNLFFYPDMPLIMGVLLGLLRGAELRYAYETPNLLDAGHPLVWCFWGLLAVYTVVELCFHWPFREPVSQPCGERLLVSGAATPVFLSLGALMVLAGSVMLLAPVLTSGSVTGPLFLQLLVGGLGVLGAGGLLLMALSVPRRQSLETRGVSVLLPALWAISLAVRCLWLYSCDPVPDSYLPDLLGILLVMLGFSYLAGFAYQDGRPKTVRLLSRLGAAFVIANTLGQMLSGFFSSGFAGAGTELLSRLALLGGAIFLLTCDQAIQRTTSYDPDPESPPPAEGSR